MTWGCRHNNSVILQRYDMDGVLNVMRRRRSETASETTRAYFDGACDVIETCMNHEWDTQEDFFTILDSIGGGVVIQ